MIQTPVIVTFANQKGGVGKTTLCATFANYLVAKGVNVIVVDCDFQNSIHYCRKSDIRKYGEGNIPYDVISFDSSDKEGMVELIDKLHNEPSLDVALVDSPGSLKVPGLVPLFVNTDLLVIPFHYDLITIPATASFLAFIEKLQSLVGEEMNVKIFLIPNLNNKTAGKRSELLLWDKAREVFSNYGEVTPKIPDRIDMQRFSTIAALDMQNSIVSPAFDKIYYAMFDTLAPLRQSRLSGIQLSENIKQENKPKAKPEPKPPPSKISKPRKKKTINN